TRCREGLGPPAAQSRCQSVSRIRGSRTRGTPCAQPCPDAPCDALARAFAAGAGDPPIPQWWATARAVSAQTVRVRLRPAAAPVLGQQAAIFQENQGETRPPSIPLCGGTT